MTKKENADDAKGFGDESKSNLEEGVDKFNKEQAEIKSPDLGLSWTNIRENIPFHDFEKENIFIGKFDSTVEVAKESSKPFDSLKFFEYETGVATMIKNNYTIVHAIQDVERNYPDNYREVIYKITFLGKTEIKGLPFNQYNVDIHLL